MLKIKDVNGDILHLYKTKLVEVTGFQYSPYLLEFKDLRETLDRRVKSGIKSYLVDDIVIRRVDRAFQITAQFHPAGYQIGCRVFDKTTYNKIVRAARQAKPKTKAARA